MTRIFNDIQLHKMTNLCIGKESLLPQVPHYNIVFKYEHAQNLYGFGARRIGVTTLPPIGCLPAAITLFGSGSNQCVARLNQDAISFNNKLKSTSERLQNRLPGLKLVLLDIYQPLMDMVTRPNNNGTYLQIST